MSGILAHLFKIFWASQNIGSSRGNFYNLVRTLTEFDYNLGQPTLNFKSIKHYF